MSGLTVVWDWGLPVGISVLVMLVVLECPGEALVVPKEGCGGCLP